MCGMNILPLQVHLTREDKYVVQYFFCIIQTLHRERQSIALGFSLSVCTMPYSYAYICRHENKFKIT